MLLKIRAIVGIAVGAAVLGILVTTALFIVLRRHENLLAAKREAAMAPITPERKGHVYWIRKAWLKEFDERKHLRTRLGANNELKNFQLMEYMLGISGETLDRICIKPL